MSTLQELPPLSLSLFNYQRPPPTSIHTAHYLSNCLALLWLHAGIRSISLAAGDHRIPEPSDWSWIGINFWRWSRLLTAQWKSRRWIWWRRSSRARWTPPTPLPAPRSPPSFSRIASSSWSWRPRLPFWSVASSFLFGDDPTLRSPGLSSLSSHWSSPSPSPSPMMEVRRSQSSTARKPVLLRDLPRY